MLIDCVITNRYELDEFTEDVIAVTGDPAAGTATLFVKWEGAGLAPEPGTIVAKWNQKSATIFLELEAETVWPLTVNIDGPVLDGMGMLHAFRPKKVCSGVWALTPSLNIAGVLHAFVIVHGVPEPAPWERLVILASGLF